MQVNLYAAEIDLMNYYFGKGTCVPLRLCEPEGFFEMIEKCKKCGKCQ